MQGFHVLSAGVVIYGSQPPEKVDWQYFVTGVVGTADTISPHGKRLSNEYLFY